MSARARTGLASSLAGASAARRPAPRSQPLEPDEFDDVDLPCDAAVAIEALARSFVQLVPVKQAPSLKDEVDEAYANFERIAPFPVVLLSQIRAMVAGSNATRLDTELAAMAQRGEIRVLRVPLEPTDAAVIRDADLRDYLRDKRGSMEEGSSIAAGTDLFGYLLGTNASRHVTISHTQLEEGVRAWRAAGCPTVLPPPPPPPSQTQSPAASSGSDTAAAAAAALLREGSRRNSARTVPLESMLKPLLQLGLLTRRNDALTASSRGGSGSAAAEAYFFGVPEASPLFAAVAAGRLELVARLRTRAYRQMPRSTAEALLLTKTPLAAGFVVRDAIGSGIVQLFSTVGGQFLRLPPVAP